MKAAVDKQEGEPVGKVHSRAFCLARRRAYVEEYFAFIFAERKREDIGPVCFVPIRFVYPLRKIIAADDEREFVVRAENTARYFFIRDGRQRPAHRFQDIKIRSGRLRARNVRTQCHFFNARWEGSFRPGALQEPARDYRDYRTAGANRGRVSASRPPCPL